MKISNISQVYSFNVDEVKIGNKSLYFKDKFYAKIINFFSFI